MFEEIFPRDPSQPKRRGRIRRPLRDGREGRTPLPVSPRLKAGLALFGMSLSLVLGVLAWRAGLTVVAVLFFAIAAWGLADTFWQVRKIRRSSGDSRPEDERPEQPGR